MSAAVDCRELLENCACSLSSAVEGNLKAYESFRSQASALLAGGHCPLAIEPTLYLLDGLRAENVLLVEARKAMLCLGISRYIDLIGQSGQIPGQPRPISAVCSEAGVPEELVDVRHKIVHKELPSLETLETSAMLALQHVLNTFWQPLVFSTNAGGQIDRPVDPAPMLEALHQSLNAISEVAPVVDLQLGNWADELQRAALSETKSRRSRGTDLERWWHQWRSSGRQRVEGAAAAIAKALVAYNDPNRASYFDEVVCGYVLATMGANCSPMSYEELETGAEHEIRLENIVIRYWLMNVLTRVSKVAIERFGRSLWKHIRTRLAEDDDSCNDMHSRWCRYVDGRRSGLTQCWCRGKMHGGKAAAAVRLSSWLTVITGGDESSCLGPLLGEPAGWQAVVRVILLVMQKEFRMLGQLYVDTCIKAAHNGNDLENSVAGQLGLVLDAVRNSCQAA